MHDPLETNATGAESPAARFKLNQFNQASRKDTGTHGFGPLARTPPVPQLRRSRPGTSRPDSNRTRFMYILEMIFRTIFNLLKEAWLLPKTIAATLQQRRRQFARQEFETERLDRIRNPSKYLGR